MKTGASWRCWTCTQNGTDQPQHKRPASGYLRLSSTRGQDNNAQKDRAQKDPGMPAKHTCAGAGAHTAAATSGCSLVAFAGAALGALSGASLTAADAATAASAASAVLLMRVALGL